jgi:hypothetical protein
MILKQIYGFERAQNVPCTGIQRNICKKSMLYKTLHRILRFINAAHAPFSGTIISDTPFLPYIGAKIVSKIRKLSYIFDSIMTL